LQADIAKGMTTSEMVEKYGCSFATLYVALHKFGLKAGRMKKGSDWFLDINAEKLAKEYKSGITVRELARMYNCSHPSMYKYLKALGLREPSKTANVVRCYNFSKDTMTELWSSGLSMKEIAEKLECDISTVYRYLREYRLIIKTQQKNIQLPMEEIAKDIAQGATLAELAVKYNCNQGTINKRLMAAGIRTKHSQRMGDITKEQLEKLISEGKTLNDLERIFNVRAALIAKVMSKYGIMTKEMQAAENLSKAQLQSYLAEGMTNTAIQEKHGISSFFLQKIFDKFGLKSCAAKIKETYKAKNITREQLNELVEQGLTQKEMAKKFDVDLNYIRKLFKVFELKPMCARKRENFPSIEKIKELLAQGKSRTQISKETGMPYYMLTITMRENGLKPLK